MYVHVVSKSIVVSKLNNIIYLEKNCHCKYFLILFFSAAIIPEFTSGLRKCHAQQGKNAKFECEVSGTPAPDVQWFKGTRELFESKKYEIYNEGDKQILVVHDVFGEDQDEYSCKASNNGGSRTSRAELEISCKFFFFCFNIVYGKKSLKIQKR